MTEQRRVGLFGGSFDPVHRAHVAIARAALDQLRLDELRWIPAGSPWQKLRDGRVLADPSDRLAMLGLAIAGEPRFVLDRSELGRAGPTFTLDTVRALVARAPTTRFFLVLGADQHAALHTWRDWRELGRLVTLAVAARPGDRSPPDPAVAALGHEPVELAALDVSSSAIRRRVAAGEPIVDLVPAEVAGYIDRRGLYRGADTRS